MFNLSGQEDKFYTLFIKEEGNTLDAFEDVANLVEGVVMKYA